MGILIFKGLTARRLYKSFGVKGLRIFTPNTDILRSIVILQGNSFRMTGYKITKLEVPFHNSVTRISVQKFGSFSDTTRNMSYNKKNHVITSIRITITRMFRLLQSVRQPRRTSPPDSLRPLNKQEFKLRVLCKP
jgi:hypothetical protein